MKKYTKYLMVILFTFLIFYFLFSTKSLAADPKLISNINNALKKIQGWIIKFATPAAAVGVGTGVFMKKFSFGDEERITIGKKLIRNSLFSYGFIMSIDLILSTINTLVGN